MSTHEPPPIKGLSGSPKSEYAIFTNKILQYLKSTDKRRIVWAKGLKGLGIRITPKGTKSFVYKYNRLECMI